ncbi:PAS domain S-box protein [Sorangium sp. So ce1504]|uniref:hybrid sensor histidine kinase/response regulator n=1 Tax=Sorangium sp. So ce1504 TaxID=3133337 RepID=UPI003F5E932E
MPRDLTASTLQAARLSCNNGSIPVGITLSAEEIEASIGRDEEVACTASLSPCARREQYPAPGELMARAAPRIARVADLDELAALLLDQAMELGARAAYLLLTSEDTGELGLHSHRHVPADIRLCLARVARGAPLLDEWAASSGRVQVMSDARSLDPGPSMTRELCARTDAQSAVSMPLRVRDRCLGVLSFCLSRPYPCADVDLGALAALFAIGLDSALAREGSARTSDRVAQELRRASHLERALREREERFRAIFDGALQFVGLLSPEGIVLENNRTALEFCRATEAETIGRPFWELTGWRPEYRERIRAAVAEAAAGRLVRDEIDVIGATGRRWIDFSIKPITDDRGRVVMLIPEGRDMTERKQMEQALRESEERFRLTFENAPIGMAIVGLGGGFIRVNRAYCEIVGYSAEALSKLRFQDITHPDDVDTDVGLVEQLRRGEISRYQLAKRYIHEDGRVIPVILHVSVVHGADGEPIHYIAQVEDVTARKQAEEERERLLAQLDAERRTLQTVFDSAPIPLLLIDRNDPERLIANPHGRDLTGGAEERSQCVGRVRHPDGTALTLDELPSSRALRGETITGEELIVARTDGSCRTFFVAAAPLRDSAGKITGAIVAAEDISPLKELARMREEWTGIIAHDLRQPITTIVLKATMLSKQSQSSDKAQHILASATQLNRMIDDLLDVSRLESHRLDLKHAEVDLPALIRATVERTADAMRGHRVDVEVLDGVPPLLADPGRLEQVLTNLLSNAAKYGAPETPIRIAVERRSGAVLVAVENEGNGIAPDDVPRLFTRYYRTREAKAGGAAGLGLGLYIVRGLVEAHGGRIWAESAPGKTTFQFTLPLP